MKIYEKLKFIREEKKITQSEIGAFLGYSYSNIKEIEAGRTKLGVDTFLKMCQFYKINPLELLLEDTDHYVILSEEELIEIDRAILTLEKIKNKTIRNFNENNNNTINVNNSTVNGDFVIGSKFKK